MIWARTRFEPSFVSMATPVTRTGCLLRLKTVTLTASTRFGPKVRNPIPICAVTSVPCS
jgi:hypothetical protein